MTHLNKPLSIKAFIWLLLLAWLSSASVVFADATKHNSWYDPTPGYLAREMLPDSLALLPPPPKPGSAAFGLDEAVHKADFGMKGSKRWQLATQDAELRFPKAASHFSCSLDIGISQKATPNLYRLLHRTFVDAAHSTHLAKVHYQRIRPFMMHHETTCTPDDEAFLRKNGSYPSGHSTIGWTWALVLSEISPKQTNALVARGRAFGQSRLFCNAHWQSDVMEGRIMGAAVFARLQSNPQFQADLKLAKQDIIKARKADIKPLRNCSFEHAALGEFPSAPWPANK